jgi:formylglycine-generating enzyme required for sulfatase activity
MRLITLFIGVLLAISSAAQAQSCRGDLNGDERIDGNDLGILLAGWGICPPTISTVSPAHGGTQGGTVISINGTGLSTTTGIRIGGVPCTGVTVLTPTLVRAVTPPGLLGEASIAVTSAGGTTLAPIPFTYVLQQVSSIVPNSGSFSGGTPITINGQFLAGATAVTVGGVPCTNVVSVSSTQLTAVTPAGSVGAMDVVVFTPKGSVTAVGGFTYLSYAVPSWATLVDPFPDPTVVTDPDLRAAIVASGFAWRVRDSGTQIEMLLVPPGTFQMGCSGSQLHGCYAFENPVHQVTLTAPFYLGRYEVTQAQWQARMGGNPSSFQFPSNEVSAAQIPNRPVDRVSWNNIQGFLSITGLRLPTEAEWEYACRAGTTTAYSTGSNDDSLVDTAAWRQSNSVQQTRPVGLLLANRLGFHDMHGNVWEWVNDWYGSYSAGSQVNPTGPAVGTYRVLRGGSWLDLADQVRSSYRNIVELPGNSSSNIGFRVARNP